HPRHPVATPADEVPRNTHEQSFARQTPERFGFGSSLPQHSSESLPEHTAQPEAGQMTFHVIPVQIEGSHLPAARGILPTQFPPTQERVQDEMEKRVLDRGQGTSRANDSARQDESCVEIGKTP